MFKIVRPPRLLFTSVGKTWAEPVPARPRRLLLTLVCLALAIWSAPVAVVCAQQATTAPSAGDELLRYLGWVIDWYRAVNSLDAAAINPRDIVYHDSVQSESRQVLQLGFAYARAQADLLGPDAGGGAVSDSQSARAKRIAKAASDAAARAAALQGELEELNRQINDGAATTRPDLLARREKVISQLNLAKARNDTIQRFSKMMGSQAGGMTLSEKIEDLARAIPEANPSTQPANTSASPAGNAGATAAAPQPFHAASAGVLGLVSEMFSLSGRMRQLNELADQTEHFGSYIDKMREPIRAQLLEAIHRGDTLAATRESDSIAKIDADRQQIDSLATRFKELSAAAVPLGGQSVAMETVRANLIQWHDSLNQQFKRCLNFLVARLGGMASVILLVLGISWIWRRATFRYIADIRRRRQFLVVRRFVVGSIIFLVLIVGFVTEFGSLATYAGLLTAGIAVALQTIILSGVAYFFVIGRYGIRVGDRVTVGGVSGDVIDVGLFRLYLMELGGTGLDLHPTGRIVVFANSVLFQGSPFYKQIPGSEYAWHQIALTLSPDSDYQLAESKLMEAVNSVYAEYHAEIEREHEAAKRSLHVQLPAPKPEGRLRFDDAGLEFQVRYPVPIHVASEIDDRITRRLLKTIEDEPKLRLCASGTPRIQAATAAT